jgi:hypothetical protein
MAVLLAAAPFIFGLIRAATARDPRLLWMALAAFTGAALVRMIARVRPSGGVVGVSIATLFLATVLAGSTAYLLGATAPAGIWMMAFVLGLCLAASYALMARLTAEG